MESETRRTLCEQETKKADKNHELRLVTSIAASVADFGLQQPVLRYREYSSEQAEFCRVQSEYCEDQTPSERRTLTEMKLARTFPQSELIGPTQRCIESCCPATEGGLCRSQARKRAAPRERVS